MHLYLQKLTFFNEWHTSKGVWNLPFAEDHLGKSKPILEIPKTPAETPETSETLDRNKKCRAMHKKQNPNQKSLKIMILIHSMEFEDIKTYSDVKHHQKMTMMQYVLQEKYEWIEKDRPNMH